MTKRQVYTEATKRFIFDSVIKYSEPLEPYLNDLTVLLNLSFDKLYKLKCELEDSYFKQINDAVKKHLETELLKELFEVLTTERDYCMLRPIVKEILSNIFIINIRIDDDLVITQDKKLMLNQMILKKYKGRIPSLYQIQIINHSGKVLESYLLNNAETAEKQLFKAEFDNKTLFNTLFDLFLHLEIRGSNE